MKSDILFHRLPAMWLEKEDAYLIYSPRQREFALLRSDLLEDPMVLRKFRQRGFFQPSSDHSSEQVHSIVLVVTKRCNLQCEYCFANSTPWADSTMAPEMAVGILHKMADLFRLDRVHFIGGEPTLNLPAIQRVVHHARELKIHPVYYITTNGTAPQSVIDWMIGQRFIFTVSWDGIKDAHDRHRPFAGGQGSVKNVQETILYLVKKNADFRVRMTVTKSNLPYLAKSVHWCADHGVKFVHPEPMRPDGRGATLLDSVVSPNEFVQVFSEIVEIAEERGLWIVNSALSNLFEPKQYFCPSARGRTYHFNPDGSISLCYQVQAMHDPLSDVFTIGYYSANNNGIGKGIGITLNRNRAERLRTLGSDAYPSCRECFLRYVCSGGCPYRSLKPGRSRSTDPWTCQSRMGILRTSIFHIYKRALQGKGSCLEGTFRFYQKTIVEREARYAQG